ncbi:TetR/AcrR family transcriptional regulator [Corallococcus sp. EGB]|uniref:TetR/AcrR family transcriptional regulator n=1 Tax=Corallococcus sp. EGB TaxID=1521117 RepID=UPI001CBB2C74|nr:TetR/AcrR family transcriptional regulator [Corallococcus sp. EGB]
MSGTLKAPKKDAPSRGGVERPVRADARRNVDALLEAAMAVFATSGVDAPVREIADKAGVGVGTLYRHFPQRSDLIVAVVRNEVDACADAASDIAARYEPGEALERWVQRYVDLLATKRGLAAALHSGDPAFKSLPDYFLERMRPVFQGLLDAAARSGDIRPDVDATELLLAIARLCVPDHHGGGAEQARRMVTLLVDGLRHGAPAAPPRPSRGRR